MEIWLDTCDKKAIAAGGRLGILYGVTSNPTILAETKDMPEKIINTVLETQSGPMAVQVIAEDAEEMIHQALALQAISKRIIIKIPVTKQGLSAMQTLTKKGIPVMATAIFEPKQALLAAVAGALYVAPYVGRMFDAGIDAYAALESMVKIFDKQGFQTKILAAALKTTEQVIACAEMGIGAVTLKNSLFLQFVADEALTMDSLNAFSNDWGSRSFQCCSAVV